MTTSNNFLKMVFFLNKNEFHIFNEKHIITKNTKSIHALGAGYVHCAEPWTGEYSNQVLVDKVRYQKSSRKTYLQCMRVKISDPV